MTEKIQPFGWQARLLALPWSLWLILAGGVGGGKTYAILLRFVQYLHEFGADAHIVVVTRGYRATVDFELALREVLGAGFAGFQWNSQSHTGTVPSGGSIEVVQVESISDTLKMAGRNITYLHVEEAGHYPTDEIVRRLFPRLRAPKGVPTCFSLTANPGGRGHAWLLRKYVQHRPWAPFTDDDGHEWVLCPSTYRDNPHLDQDAYERNLRTAHGAGSGMYEAVADGAWNRAVAGGIFADLLGDHVLLDRNVWTPEALGYMADWLPQQRRAYGRFKFGLDHGSARPSVGLLGFEVGPEGLRGPDGRHYPANSWLILDEAPVADRQDPAVGLYWSPQQIADYMNAMLGRWGARGCSKVADDAIFAKSGSGAGSIADELRKAGLPVQKARKTGRVDGWNMLRQSLSAAGTDAPGLYISTRCSYLLDEMLALPRDERNPEDADTKAPDHASDTLRYLVACRGRQSAAFSTVPFFGS